MDPALLYIPNFGTKQNLRKMSNKMYTTKRHWHAENTRFLSYYLRILSEPNMFIKI